MTRGAALAVLAGLAAATVAAQAPPPDTALVQGGIYQRPFIVAAGRTAVGGYLEAHGGWSRTEGISEGPSFEVRRFNVFLYSALGRRIRVTSELEFEHGTEEIALETALVDFVVTPSLVIRAGVLLTPIGAFNVNHDGPRYEFVDRPLVSTEIIPATLSEAGLGIHGRLAPPGVSLSYDVYLTNGLGSGVVLNETGRTHLPSGKGESLFAEDENGSPAASVRVAAQHRQLGEVGLSHYRAVYNTWRMEGERVDDPRWLSITAVDLATGIGPVDLRGEVAFAGIDLPSDQGEVLGDRQWGVYLDAVMPVWRPKIRALDNPTVNVGVRLERVDFNVGRFTATGGKRFDEVNAVSVAVSFRPLSGTVFRLNYRLESFRDVLGNPAERTAAVRLGVATYF
ncbi:MAG TPA: TonB-dependent receptor [Gemmatimonadales bacterium]